MYYILNDKYCQPQKLQTSFIANPKNKKHSTNGPYNLCTALHYPLHSLFQNYDCFLLKYINVITIEYTKRNIMINVVISSPFPIYQYSELNRFSASESAARSSTRAISPIRIMFGYVASIFKSPKIAKTFRHSRGMGPWKRE